MKNSCAAWRLQVNRERGILARVIEGCQLLLEPADLGTPAQDREFRVIVLRNAA